MVGRTLKLGTRLTENYRPEILNRQVILRVIRESTIYGIRVAQHTMLISITLTGRTVVVTGALKRVENVVSTLYTTTIRPLPLLKWKNPLTVPLTSLFTRRVVFLWLVDLLNRRATSAETKTKGVT